MLANTSRMRLEQQRLFVVVSRHGDQEAVRLNVDVVTEAGHLGRIRERIERIEHEARIEVCVGRIGRRAESAGNVEPEIRRGARRAEARVGCPPQRESGRRVDALRWRFAAAFRASGWSAGIRSERAAQDANSRGALAAQVGRQLLIAVGHLEPRLDLVGVDLLAADFEQQIVGTQCVEVRRISASS